LDAFVTLEVANVVLVVLVVVSEVEVSGGVVARLVGGGGRVVEVEVVWGVVTGTVVVVGAVRWIVVVVIGTIRRTVVVVVGTVPWPVVVVVVVVAGLDVVGVLGSRPSTKVETSNANTIWADVNWA
jgi:hypothetical protein